MMEIDVQAAKQWLDATVDDQGTPVYFLDCREPGEHQTACIPGTNLIPMSQWPPSQEQVQAMEGKRIVVLCHHGGRSLRVTQWLRQNGYPETLSMAGGIDAWSTEIDPSIPRY
jgi:rhodanese-related sulfurtransferase